MLFRSAQHSTAQHSTAQHSTAQHRRIVKAGSTSTSTDVAVHVTLRLHSDEAGKSEVGVERY